MLYFDCFSGASGDMVLGALLDLGLPLDALKSALGSLAIEYGEVTAERVSRAGVAATKFKLVERANAAADHGHDRHDHAGHQHHDHAGHHHDHHHSLSEIAAAIRRSALSAEGKDRAIHLFQRLAEAEAAIHQIPVERVHLHEVGALDSIVDIVGAVYGFEWFGIDDIASSPLNVGGGMVKCAHGTFPVPAPATAALLKGTPVYSTGVQMELVTPTGALLITGYAREFGPLPAMTMDAVGYGAGDRDLKDTPNVLRVLRGERSAAAADERLVALECEIDDMNPQLFGPLMDGLYAAGALDVFYTAVMMKKNRPGTLVTVLACPDRRDAIVDRLFRESTTIGVRYRDLHRARLDRVMETVETPYGAVRFKVARRGNEILNASPEFDDCVRLAAERGVPIKDVQAAAIKAREQPPSSRR
ncbi:MAG: nickel pincer cofactor biosynthesis protein LarC [Acidobacteria bacterium]|nr:MAG: nickel pincer cofactor biosynthesis protein LarC [Acidobacteriota bacterium]